MRRPVLSLVLAFFVLMAVWASLPAAATHTTSYSGSFPSNGEQNNHAFSTLTISGFGSGGAMANSSTAQWLKVDSSSGVKLTKVHVGSSLTISGSTQHRHNESTVSGQAYLNSSSHVKFYQMTFKGSVQLSANNVEFRDSVLEQCYTQDAGSYNITFVNTQVLGCPSATAAPPNTASSAPTASTSHPDCYQDGQFVPCPSPTTASCAYPQYYDPSLGRCAGPTYPTSTYTRPTGGFNDYSFQLVGKVVTQDLFVKGADRVEIRDSKVWGSIYIASSAHILLENVDVTGDLRIEASGDITGSRLRVGGSMGLLGATSFRLADGSVLGMLGCLRCSDGSFTGFRVGGAVEIADSTNVQRIDVVEGSRFTLPSSPLPTASGGVIMKIGDHGLEFEHARDVPQLGSAPVRLAMNAAEAHARLELAPADDPGRPRIKLDTRFEKIVEYEDRNGDGAFDLSDLVLNEFLIDDLEVASLRQERLGDSDQGWRGRIDYAIPRGGTFSLIFTAKDASPDQTKIDVAFDGYAYETSTSRLALQVRLASASLWTIEEGDGEDRLRFRGEGIDGYFSWLKTAEADGATVDVTARVLEEHRTESGERQVVLYLGYPHAESIFHDPSIGVLDSLVEDLGSIGNVLVYGTTLIAVIAVLWALGQSSRRRPQ